MGTNRIKRFLPKPQADEESNLSEPLAPTNPLEAFFNQVLSAAGHKPSPLRATEHPDHFEVTLEVPAFTKEELSLTLKNGVLYIAGKKGESTESGENHISEISYTITLGDGLDVDNVEASHKDGVLTIKVPKTQDPDAKTIEIK